MQILRQAPLHGFAVTGWQGSSISFFRPAAPDWMDMGLQIFPHFCYNQIKRGKRRQGESICPL
ncbi:MAG: hypothetical protein ACLTL5_10070, partial [Oscillospiraceae bacterium]